MPLRAQYIHTRRDAPMWPGSEWVVATGGALPVER